MNKNNVVKTPVKYSSPSAQLAAQVKRDCEFEEDYYGEDEGQSIVQEQPCLVGGQTPDNLDKALKEAEKKEKEQGSSKFTDQIKIDFIPSIDYRILCRFLGVTSVGEIKNHPYQAQPLITLILMESLESFMKSKGFVGVGELNFDQHGNSIPPEKNPWSVKGKETTFTTTGFVYFEKIGGDKSQNVAFFLFTDLDRGGASITSYSTDTNRSKEIINELELYSKKNNCLRGAKLRDVNMISASFSEVIVDGHYNWDNFYYTKEIQKLFDLEVFGFIRDVDKYKSRGIVKRGLLLHGKPGCVLAGTQIKIRKKKKEGKHIVEREL